MPDMQDDKQPAILLHGFETFEACRNVASELLSNGFPVITVCAPGEGGADSACQAGCIVIEAEKGNALRMGLEYFSLNMEGLPGIVALDASEGYSLEDVLKVAGALQANPGKLVVASRTDDPAIGLLPRLERLVAWLAFKLVHGRSVGDAWAGLKAFPAALAPAFLDIKGEGNQYQFSIVLNLQHKGIKAVNVPVSANYAFAEGSGLWGRAGDIFRTLILPFKFVSASLLATLCDYAVFLLLDTVLLKGHWAISMTTSRGAGAIVGYFLNRNLVFTLKNNSWQKELAAACQFALLALFNYGASMLIVYILHDLLHINEIIARPISDAMLFVTSYTIQREFIFRRKSPSVK